MNRMDYDEQATVYEMLQHWIWGSEYDNIENDWSDPWAKWEEHACAKNAELAAQLAENFTLPEDWEERIAAAQRFPRLVNLAAQELCQNQYSSRRYRNINGNSYSKLRTCFSCKINPF